MPPSLDGWRRARLIPAAGIKSVQEQEVRATSALLSVMMAVPEFAKAVLRHLDAPAGRVTTFTEVSLPSAGTNQKGSKVRPDGAIVVERGKTWWGCFVEVKTGGNQHTEEQVSAYLDLARENGLQALLTISNEIAAVPGESPLSIDRRKLGRVALRHLSWWRVLTEAVVQYRYRGVNDLDQAWILNELIAYLEDPRSGAGSFEDLGPHWVTVRDGARQGTLRLGEETKSVVGRWEDFVRYVCLGLCQELGREVEPVYPRRLDPHARRAAAERTLVESGCLNTTNPGSRRDRPDRRPGGPACATDRDLGAGPGAQGRARDDARALASSPAQGCPDGDAGGGELPQHPRLHLVHGERGARG
jgi:hypothetical protein